MPKEFNQAPPNKRTRIDPSHAKEPAPVRKRPREDVDLTAEQVPSPVESEDEDEVLVPGERQTVPEPKRENEFDNEITGRRDDYWARADGLVIWMLKQCQEFPLFQSEDRHLFHKSKDPPERRRIRDLKRVDFKDLEAIPNYIFKYIADRNAAVPFNWYIYSQQIVKWIDDHLRAKRQEDEDNMFSKGTLEALARAFPRESQVVPSANKVDTSSFSPYNAGLLR